MAEAPSLPRPVSLAGWLAVVCLVGVALQGTVGRDLEGGASRGDGKNRSDPDQSYTKRHKTNASRQDSQNESEAGSEQKSGQMPKMRLLDRSQLMDMMLFP